MTDVTPLSMAGHLYNLLDTMSEDVRPADISLFIQDLRAEIEAEYDAERAARVPAPADGAEDHGNPDHPMKEYSRGFHDGWGARSAEVPTPADGLDVAWAAVEAASPEGWRGPVLRRSYDFPDQYWALSEEDPGDHFREGYGPTPVAALNALRVALEGAES